MRAATAGRMVRGRASARGIGGPGSGRLALECALLFAGLPGWMAWLRAAGRPVPVLGTLAVAALLAWVALLRDPGFDRRALVRWEPGRAAWRWILGRFALGTLLLAAWLLLLEPERWLQFPRQRPLLWGAVMLLYPLLSVYPQELLFRALFLRRYRALFGTGRGAALASALAFGWAHVVFLSWLSVALTLLGGLLFARTYQRTRSLPLVCVEHGLYGCLIFTIGLGRHFFAAA